MKTKYGYIAIVEENRIKKLDFKNSKLISTDSFYKLLSDKGFLKQILGY